MSELLSCPFCGFAGCITSKNMIGSWRFAYCPDCMAEGPARDEDSGAVESWNRRADSAELATLRAERDALRELHAVIVKWPSITKDVRTLKDGAAALDRIDKLGEQDG